MIKLPAGVVVVQHWDDFEITWYVSDDPGAPHSSWIKVATISCPLYVTHDAPILTLSPGSLEPTKAFETLLYLGCKNASGASLELRIVNRMYNEFKDQDVKKVGGTMPMTYWGPVGAPEPGCWETSGLLEFEDGRCGAWADFFNDMIKVQGIPGSEISEVNWNYILNSTDFSRFTSEVVAFFGSEVSSFAYEPYTYAGTTGAYAQFLVKNWILSPTENFVISEFDMNFIDTIVLVNGNEIIARKDTGAVLQGNPDPRSEFNNHAIVKYRTDYYDPSYGTDVRISSNDWENHALDGFSAKGRYIKVVGGLTIEYDVLWIGYLNTSIMQTNITP